MIQLEVVLKNVYYSKTSFFPLPEYELFNDSVKVTIEGKVLDVKYASKLANARTYTWRNYFTW